MLPTIQRLPAKKLIGMHLNMSLAANRTFELWNSFMPRRKEIANQLSTELISMQVYADAYSFAEFDPTATFEKWAAVEVADFSNMPDGMEPYILNGGLYAVFVHKGPASRGAETFSYIFNNWLPASVYALDKREHFEVLGEKYKNNYPNSEETIWIPVKLK